MKLSGWLVFACVALAVFAWLARWEIVPSSEEGTSSAYVLDRWTGNVHWSIKNQIGKTHRVPDSYVRP